METTFLLVDPLKIEETIPLTYDTGEPANGSTKRGHELLKICSTCMSTTNVRPLPRSACNWLTAITYGQYIPCGVCTQCWPVLRRSLKFVNFVKKTQRELLELERRNELFLTYVREHNIVTERQPFIKLSTNSFCFGVNDNLRLYDDQKRTDSIKLTIDGNNSCHNNDNIMARIFVNSNSKSDKPIAQKIETNVQKIIYKEISLDDLLKRNFSGDDNRDNDDIFDENNSESDNESTTQKNINKKISLEDLLKSDFSDDDNDDKIDGYESDMVTSTKVKTVQNKLMKKTKKISLPNNDNDSSGNETITAIKPEKNLTKYDSNSDDSNIEKLMKIIQTDNETNPVGEKLTADLARLVADHVRADPVMKPDDEKIVKHFDMKPFTVMKQMREMLSKKLVPEYENAKYKCETCYQGFSQEEDYENHVKGHLKGEITCRVCLKRFASTSRFTNHIRWHLDRWIFSCKQCLFTTKRIDSARLHARIHEGQTQNYECNICGKVFTLRPSFLSHMRLVHPSDHVCVLCGYSFIGERGIFCHRYLKHKGEDPTVGEDGPLCELCDIRFKTDDALLTHQRVSRRHGGKGYNQPIAKLSSEHKRRANPAPPLDNRARVQREPLIPCEQCGQGFHGARAYRYHFARAHPTAARTVFFEKSELSLCTVCGMSVSNLCNHMAQHEEGSFSCATCNKTFKTKMSLNNHKTVHRVPRHQCPTCGKRFNQRANLNRHFTYVHSSTRDVKCDYCDKCFKSVADVKNHVNYVHLKKPWPKKNTDKSVSARKRRKRDSDSDSMDAFAGY